jgi:hypothetical protein
LLATFVFALSNIVMGNRTVVLQYWLPHLFDLPTGIFRSSGRFVWPVIYAGMTALTALLGRIRPRWATTVLMSAALILQVWDIRPLVFQKRYFESLVFQSRLVSPNWNTAAAASTGITTFPPFSFSTVQWSDYRDICWLADQYRVPTTAGYAARMSVAAAALTDSMRTALEQGTADPTHLYICDRSSFPEVFAGLSDHCLGAIWDGYFVCYNRQWPVTTEPDYTAAHRSTLAEFLAERGDRILLLAARDEATNNLSEAGRQALRNLGIVDSEFTYRGAIAAIVDHGGTVWQRINPCRRIELALAAGDTLGRFRSLRAINLVSAGFESGNEAQLRLDGKEEGFNGRGLNVLVLDDDQRLLEVAWFDTHAGKPGFVLTVAKDMIGAVRTFSRWDDR